MSVVDEITVPQILEDAAKALETYGWRQGNYGDCSTGFCAEGAIMHAVFERIDPLRGTDRYSDEWDRLVFGAEYALHPLIGEIGYYDGDPVVEWNDTEGRTQEDVISLLRQAAAEIAKVETS